MTHLAVWLTLAAANFIYAGFGAKDWGSALERSYFQAMAVFICWLWIDKGWK